MATPTITFQTPPGGLGGSGSDSTWAAARADKFDVTGLGIPGHPSG